MIHKDLLPSDRLAKIEESMPSVMEKMIEEKERRSAFFLTTCGTFDFTGAAHAYISGIMKGLNRLRRSDPFGLIDQIDFVQKNANQIPIIFGSFSRFIKLNDLDRFLEGKNYLKDEETPIIAGNTRLRLRAEWKLVSPYHREQKYDVFISYRRNTGSDAARLIQMSLRQEGMNVFLDVDELQSGHFDERLLQVIENTPNFIVILSKGCLGEGSDNADFFFQEIAHAIKTGCNIVPVIMNDFVFPDPAGIRDELRALPRYNGISYSHDYFDAVIAKLLKYVKRESSLSVPSESPQTFEVLGREKQNEVDTEIMKGLMTENYQIVLTSFKRIGEEDKEKYYNTLIGKLSSSSSRDRLAALTGLFYIRYKDVTPHLMIMAKDKSNTVRRRAVYYLGALRAKNATGILSQLCSDKSADVRAAAREAYKKITGRSP